MVEITDERNGFYSYHRPRVEPFDDGLDVEIMKIRKSPGAESVIAVVSGSMVPVAQWNCA